MDLQQIKRQLVIYSGLNALRRRSRTKPRVLFWHGVDAPADALICPEVFPVSLFKKQINYLRRHFDIISIREFHERLDGGAFRGNEVLLTFDDGYANNLQVVEPILSSMGLPFTVFISTDNISTGDFYPTSVNRMVTIASGLKELSIPTLGQVFPLTTDGDRISVSKKISREMKSRPLNEVKGIVKDLLANLPADEWNRLKEQYGCLQPMNWDQVRQLSRQGNVTIGSHCMWHICCHEHQDDEVVREQILSSKQLIESHLQQPCDYFAYPNGNYTDHSNGCVNEAYRLGFSAETKTSVDKSHRCILPRIAAYTADMSLFKLLVSS